MFFEHWDMGNPSDLWRRGLEGQLEHALETGQFSIDRPVSHIFLSPCSDIFLDAIRGDGRGTELFEVNR